jgi:branched-chain amino acid transport system ATP-binding protein
MTAPTLVAASVSRSFSGVRALEGVDLRLDQAEILGLIGPNGSGKSTLVNVISGALRPDAGRVLLNGEDVTGHSPRAVARKGVARTFQTVRLFPSMTVRENLHVGVISGNGEHRNVDGRVDELLSFADLRPWAHAPAMSIPYGLQRRVEVARSLATRPVFLMLDEPAAGLNEEESDQLLELIRRIHDGGVGVLVIDHDLRLILRLCHRVHVLVQGRSLAEGTPAEVRSDPAVVEAYIGAHRNPPPPPAAPGARSDQSKTDEEDQQP